MVSTTVCVAVAVRVSVVTETSVSVAVETEITVLIATEVELKVEKEGEELACERDRGGARPLAPKTMSSRRSRGAECTSEAIAVRMTKEMRAMTRSGCVASYHTDLDQPASERIRENEAGWTRHAITTG